MIDRTELDQRLEHWREAEAATLAYLEYTRAQIHRVRCEIGALTIEQMRERGKLSE